jgi:hypothetical protein
MRGKKAKQIRRYAEKLQEMHPEVYVDRTKVVKLKRGFVLPDKRIVATHRQRFSGWRMAKLHARLGLQIEGRLA